MGIRKTQNLNEGVDMTKTLLPVYLSVLLILPGCFHRTSPPKTKAEFLLMPSSSQIAKTEKPEEVMERKKAVYHSLKGLSSKNNILIIYDASGSMRDKIGTSGVRKFEAAYEGLKQIGTLFRQSDNVRLFVFGSKKSSGITNEGVIPRKDYIRAVEASGDVESVYHSPPEGFSQKDFLTTIRFLGSESTYIGDTPIGYSVLRAHQVLKGSPNAKVILITDGLETGPVLAQNVSKDKKSEERLRKKYPNYDELTISASESIKKLVADNIHFSPILYGLGGSLADKSGRGKEAQDIRNFYQKLATESGSIYLEAVTPVELLNAFMDAEIMSLTYGLYSLEQAKKDQLVARGKTGISLMVEDGRYLLKTETEKPFEQEVEVKPRVRNIYFFSIDQNGKLKITPGQ